MELFAAMPWNDYLTDMSRNGVYGEHITLNAIATLYNIQITVVSSQGPAARAVFNDAEKREECVLGNFAEGNGDHYVNLEFQEEVSYEEITNIVPSDNECMKNELNQQGVKNSVDFTIRQPVDYCNNLPDEIWVKIIRFALRDSDFSKENHICKMYNSLLNLNMRFSRIDQSCRDQLPRIYFPNEDLLPKEKNGYITASVISLIRKFGSFSGIVLELKRIFSQNKKWMDCLGLSSKTFIGKVKNENYV